MRALGEEVERLYWGPPSLQALCLQAALPAGGCPPEWPESHGIWRVQELVDVAKQAHTFWHVHVFD